MAVVAVVVVVVVAFFFFFLDSTVKAVSAQCQDEKTEETNNLADDTIEKSHQTARSTCRASGPVGMNDRVMTPRTNQKKNQKSWEPVEI